MEIGDQSGITTPMISSLEVFLCFLQAPLTPFYTFPLSFSCILSSSPPISRQNGASFTHIYPFFHHHLCAAAIAPPLRQRFLLSSLIISRHC